MSRRHLEPPQELKLQSGLPHPVASRRPSLFKAAVLALVLVGAGGFGLNKVLHAAPDVIPPNTQAELRQAFAAMPPLRLEPVADTDIQQAIDSMKLAPAQRLALTQRLALSQAQGQDTTRLAWVNVWDFADEDGDVVQLSSAGFEIEVRLLNAHARIAIPVDSTHALRVLGVQDGAGGGITLGIAGSVASASLPVLTPGQILNVPLAF